MLGNQKLAIDIGSDSIKILCGNKKRISYATSIITPENSVEDSKIIDLEKIHNAIGNCISTGNIKAKSVSFTLRGQDIVIRNTEIPIMDNKILKETIEWETNQYLPQNGTNYYFDYQVIGSEKTDDKRVYKVITVAAPKEKIDQYVELSSMLDLNLDAIDIAANCAARVLKNRTENRKKSKDTGIIDIGNKSSSITILDNGKLFIEREVPFGTDNIIREISRILEVNMNGAIKYLINNFEFNNIKDEIDIRIEELFNNVFSTFLNAIEFYTSGKIQKSLDELFVIGEGSKIKAIDDYMSRYFSSPVIIVDSIEKTGRKVKLPTECDLNIYFNALGLLLRKE